MRIVSLAPIGLLYSPMKKIKARKTYKRLEHLNPKINDKKNNKNINDEPMAYLEWAKYLTLQPNLCLREDVHSFLIGSADSIKHIGEIIKSARDYNITACREGRKKVRIHKIFLKENYTSLKFSVLDWLSHIANLADIPVSIIYKHLLVENEFPKSLEWIKFLRYLLESADSKQVEITKILNDGENIISEIHALKSWFEVTFIPTINYVKTTLSKIDFNFSRFALYLSSANINNFDAIKIKMALVYDVEQIINSFYLLRTIREDLISKVVIPAVAGLLIYKWYKNNYLQIWYENEIQAENLKNEIEQLAKTSSKSIMICISLYEQVKAKIGNSLLEEAMCKADIKIYKFFKFLLDTNPLNFISNALNEFYQKKCKTKIDENRLKVANKIFSKPREKLIAHSMYIYKDVSTNDYLDCIKTLCNYFYIRSKRTENLEELCFLIKNYLLVTDNNSSQNIENEYLYKTHNNCITRRVVHELIDDNCIKESAYLLLNTTKFSELFYPATTYESAEIFKLNAVNKDNENSVTLAIYNFVYNILEVIDQHYCYLVLRSLVEIIADKSSNKESVLKITDQLFERNDKVENLFDIPNSKNIHEMDKLVLSLPNLATLAHTNYKYSATVLSSSEHKTKEEINELEFLNDTSNPKMTFLRYSIYNLIKILNLYLYSTTSFANRNLIAYATDRSIASIIGPYLV